MKNNQHQGFKDSVNTHQASILRSLEHRLEAAKTKGDETLVRQLEAEKGYYK